MALNWLNWWNMTTSLTATSMLPSEGHPESVIVSQSHMINYIMQITSKLIWNDRGDSKHKYLPASGWTGLRSDVEPHLPDIWQAAIKCNLQLATPSMLACLPKNIPNWELRCQKNSARDVSLVSLAGFLLHILMKTLVPALKQWQSFPQNSKQ